MGIIVTSRRRGAYKPLLRALLLGLICIVGLPGAGKAQTQQNGTLSFSVVVIDELTPKPAQLVDFQITDKSGAVADKRARTDESGKISIELPPGEYTISTVQPVKFQGRLLSWQKEFKIESGGVCTVQLTDADATQTSAVQRISDEALIYQNAKKAVVTVECDRANGSGFVVDQRGLLLTNNHVAFGTQWAAVRFDKGVRFEAKVLEQDEQADVAVLWVNPETCKDVTVIQLADVSGDPVAMEGEKVIAIGSPLSQEKVMTIGIVSKVDQDVLSSDVNINPGNSGGPLLNMIGKAVGITTFAEQAKGAGPGISGIVAIQKALPALEKARAKLDTIQPPSAQLLSDVSPTPVPADTLDAAAEQEKKEYRICEPKNFETRITTPFIVASEQATEERKTAKGRKKRTKGRGEAYEMTPKAFYERSDAVVTVSVIPRLKQTAASKTKGFLTAILTGVLTGGLATTTGKAEYGFRSDFQEMQLYRGGKLIQPVRRNRAPWNALFDYYSIKISDVAFGGQYKYDPSTFEPGEKLVLKIRTGAGKDTDNWSEVDVSKEIQQQIWEEFALWREAVSKAGGKGAGS